MKQISIVIPVYNEEKFIGDLLSSIQKVNYPKENFEIIVVSDGSTDDTNHIVKQYPEAKLIELPENVGRYYARKRGAEAASKPNILFIDARSVVAPDILAALDQIDAKAVNGYVLGVENPGPFETFYVAIRRKVFAQFYKSHNQPFYLTLKNFDSTPKGTGVFYVEKEVLFAVYEELAGTDMGRQSSDDTKLLRMIVNHVQILVHPAVKITNFARASFRLSIEHLFGRGTKFVDYYLHPSKKYFWLVICLPLLLFFGMFAGFFLIPLPWITRLAALLGIDILLTLFLAKTAREFTFILFMLPLCSCVFYAGILRGIFLKCVSIFSFATKGPNNKSRR